MFLKISSFFHCGVSYFCFLEVIFFKVRLPIILIIVVLVGISSTIAFNQLNYVQMLDEHYDNISRLKEYESDDVIRVYKALNTVTENEEILQIVKVKGYKGSIKLMTNIDINQHELSGVTILSHSETEAYGGYITEKWFLDRFNGKKVDEQLKLVKIIAESTNEVVAVTGATISSEAVVDGVNISLENYKKMYK